MRIRLFAAAGAVVLSALVVTSPAHAAPTARFSDDPIVNGEASCLDTATDYDFVKAVCGPGGTWGVEEDGADPEFVVDDGGSGQAQPALSGAKAMKVAAAAAANGTENQSIRHSLTNNWIENTYANVYWAYVDGKTSYTGSYSVDLRTNLSGRTGIYSLYLKHISGRDIIVGNMTVGCREDGFIPLNCGDIHPADHTLGNPLSWENRKGNSLNNGDKYHTAFNSHVEVFGDTLPVGTLSSSQFTCPDKTGDSVKDRCYFKK